MSSNDRTQAEAREPRFRGAAAIVTGGGTGVGRATALRLAARGCAVALNYRVSRDEAEATVSELRDLGVSALALEADVSSDADCRRLVETTAGEFGRLDYLVNNAGTTRFIDHDDLESVETEDWERIFAVNLRGPFQCARAARPHLERSAGAIVNVTSIAGIAAIGSSIPYAASKAALNNLTVFLARVLAPRVRVNAIAPGFIAGRWLERGLGASYSETMQSAAAATPLGRVCEPDDVAAAIVSVLSGSAMVTGQVLVCDGGSLVRG